MNPAERDLVEALVDGALAEADLPRVEALLRDDAEARKAYRRAVELEAGLTETAAAGVWAEAATPDASAKLMQLRKPQSFRILDDHEAGVRNVHTYFDNRRCNQ